MTDRPFSNSPGDSGDHFDDQLRMIAGALVGEAPEAPPFPSGALPGHPDHPATGPVDIGVSDITVAGRGGGRARQRRSLGSGRFAIVGVAAALVLLAGFMWLRPMNDTPGADAPSIVSQPDDPDADPELVPTPPPGDVRPDDQRSDDESETAPVEPFATPTPFPTPTDEQLAQVVTTGIFDTNGDPMLGVSFGLTAREDAGVSAGTPGQPDQREIFVYDEPWGEPRRITSGSDSAPVRLLHPEAGGAPLTLSVIAGGFDDEWLRIASPALGGGTVWVWADDFDRVVYDSAVVVDVGDRPSIRVVRSGELMLDEPISLLNPQARELVPEPVIGSWVQSVLLDGNGQIDTIELGTVLPAGELPPQRARLRSMRSLTRSVFSRGDTIISDATAASLAALVIPGMPVFVVDESQDEDDAGGAGDAEGTGAEDQDVTEVSATERAAIARSERWIPAADLNVTAGPGPTVGLDTTGALGPATLGDQLTTAWTSCPRDPSVDDDALGCFQAMSTGPDTDFLSSEPRSRIGSFFLVAQPEAGLPANQLPASPSAASSPSAAAPRSVSATMRISDDTRVIPVYDEPGGEPRLLVYENNVDQVSFPYPLINPSVFDQPLVLRIVRGLPGDEWLQVQAPTRPKRRTIWVRADDFVFASTTTSIDIDARVGGGLVLSDRNEPILESLVVSARDSRPHTFHDTYIDQVFQADILSPAYGNWLASHNTWSNALGTFGGNGMPGQTLHGTNQPELIDQAVSSGGVRVSDETMQQIVDAPDGLLGASIVIYHGGRDQDARDWLTEEPWSPAETMQFDPEQIPEAPVPSYS